MSTPKLKPCPFLGPTIDAEKSLNRPLPADYKTRPFKYLPPRLTLSDRELDLASRYEKGDISGGYIASQIAYFRRGPTNERHQQRQAKFRRLKAEVDRLGLILPNAYIKLMESDDFVTRLRHNNIWLQLPDKLVALPSNPEHKLFLIFGEAQGCGYWHLLLAPDGGHIVTYSAYPIGLSVPEPDLASIEVCQCAEGFEAWIVNFFAEVIAEDHYYEMLLEKYPGE